ncbi:MAG: hypothetical protein ACJ8IR_13480 [Alphaproteobacteria bacterium]|jgi:hypothetical protein
MLRMTLAASALALSLAMPAFAQNTMSGPSTMKASDTSMTCDQMMAKANSMSVSSTGARMTMAQNQKHMAMLAKQKNDEAGCKMHMEKAMGYMK